MELSIKWMDKGKWILFDVNDILHVPRNHALALFNRSIPVIIRQDDTIISNHEKTLDNYRKDPKFTVTSLNKIERSEGILRNIGFV